MSEYAVTCQKTDLGWLRHADHVYQEIKPQARDGILACMEREREGDQVDRALLKNTLEIFQEVREPVLATSGAACMCSAAKNAAAKSSALHALQHNPH